MFLLFAPKGRAERPEGPAPSSSEPPQLLTVEALRYEALGLGLALRALNPPGSFGSVVWVWVLVWVGYDCEVALLGLLGCGLVGASDL